MNGIEPLGEVNNYFYRWFCVPLEEQCTTHLKNNTPVYTEVVGVI